MNPVAAHLLYVLAAIVVITVVLLAGVAARIEWCRRVFRAWDYLGAALGGGDGRHSISAYCGRAMLSEDPPTPANIALVLLGGLINGIFGSLHCENAARKEWT